MLNLEISYVVSVSLAWSLIALFLTLFSLKDSGLRFNLKQIVKDRNKILFLTALVLLGLLLFVFLGITKYFHSVMYPIVFFLVTPIVEEIIFRGWIYGQIEKFKFGSPIIISSLLFGFHHLQYFDYRLTLFAIFQIFYTFVLGLLLARIRKLSGSIYLGLVIHILINFITLKF